uniref:Cna B-type domain-containing protein n=1 Tax=Aedoeadaptatus acetigenes TaxID=2981723 RepID=UPI0011DDA4F5
ANSYDKLDRNNKNYFEDDGEYEELFKEAVGETWFEYIGQSNNYSSRDNIRFNLLSSYYNKIKSPTQIDPSKTDIKVKKVWKDQTNKVTDPMEEKVTVELYKDGKATGKKVTLNDANNWTATFEQIENTSESKYTVKEIGEKDGRIEIRRDFYSVIYEGNRKDGFTVENKYINEERAYVPIGKHIILPKGTADQKRENLL